MRTPNCRSIAAVAWMFFALGCPCADAVHGEDALVWSRLPPLENTPGFGGPFAGVSGGALIVAGGANFPEAPPWQGGAKRFYDTIHVLDRVDGAWRVAGKLPRPLAYGGSVATRGGVLCIGGHDATHCSRDVFFIVYRDGRATIEPGPALPEPISSGCAAAIGDRVFVCGGQATVDPLAGDALRAFYTLDLAERTAGWRAGPKFPGAPRSQSVAAALAGRFYVVGGMNRRRNAQGAFALEYFRDGYGFDPGQAAGEGKWSRIADLPRTMAAAPSPAPALDEQRFVVVGGGANGAGADRPQSERPGPTPDCTAYDARTNTWSLIGQAPAPRVTVPTSFWNGRAIIPSGEVRPGVRSPEVWAMDWPKH